MDIKGKLGKKKVLVVVLGALAVTAVLGAVIYGAMKSGKGGVKEIASEIEDDPTYYPSQPTITVTKNQFTKAEGSDKYTFTVEDEFVAASAEYIVKHYLKDLTIFLASIVYRIFLWTLI